MSKSSYPANGNTLNNLFKKGLIRLITSLKRTLHLKMLVIQIDSNLKCFYDEIVHKKEEDEIKDKEKGFDFDVSQANFNKHYDNCY